MFFGPCRKDKMLNSLVEFAYERMAFYCSYTLSINQECAGCLVLGSSFVFLSKEWMLFSFIVFCSYYYCCLLSACFVFSIYSSFSSLLCGLDVLIFCFLIKAFNAIGFSQNYFSCLWEILLFSIFLEFHIFFKSLSLDFIFDPFVL